MSLNAHPMPEHRETTDILNVLQEAIHAGGNAIMACKPNEGEVQKEGGWADVVMKADRESQKAILERIQATFPGDAILSEEMMSSPETPLQQPHIWIIDPVDGTRNFKTERLQYAVSIGYAEHGTIKVAAILNPATGELFVAEAGKGAWLMRGDSKSKLSVSGAADLQKVQILTDNAYSGTMTHENLQRFLSLGEGPWLRMIGSAAYGLAEVAAGRGDLYFHNSLKPFDIGAAILLVQEAGGTVKNYEGNDATFMDSQIIAGNPTLVQQFLEKTH